MTPPAFPSTHLSLNQFTFHSIPVSLRPILHLSLSSFTCPLILPPCLYFTHPIINSLSTYLSLPLSIIPAIPQPYPFIPASLFPPAISQSIHRTTHCCLFPFIPRSMSQSNSSIPSFFLPCLRTSFNPFPYPSFINSSTYLPPPSPLFLHSSLNPFLCLYKLPSILSFLLPSTINHSIYSPIYLSFSTSLHSSVHNSINLSIIQRPPFPYSCIPPSFHSSACLSLPHILPPSVPPFIP